MPDLIPVKCARCNVLFGLDEATNATLRKSSGNFCCPFGHNQHFPLGESERDKLQRERDQLKQRIAQVSDDAAEARQERDAARRSARAYKGQTTKLRRRAKAGVCPCCNRTFENLARHMAGQHPDFEPEAEA